MPQAFVVRDGTVLWAGSPWGVGGVLETLRSGTFDPVAAKASYERIASAARHKRATDGAVRKATGLLAQGDVAAGEAALTKAERDYPELTARVEMERFTWLSRRDPKAWEARARELAASARPGDRKTLLDFAVALSRTRQSGALAKEAMEIALAMGGDDFATQHAASDYFRLMEDSASELRAIDRALALFPASSEPADAYLKRRLTERRAQLTKP